METLIRQLSASHSPSEALQKHLAGILKEQTLKRKSFLLKAGQVCRNIYFVEKGLFRSYYLRQDTEVCSAFMKEGDVLFSVHSFYRQVPGYESIQALEESNVKYISYDELQDTFIRFPELNVMRALFAEQLYCRSEQRLYAMRMMRAADRFTALREQEPALLDRVPARYIASYLGITEQTLSNIRNGKKY